MTKKRKYIVVYICAGLLAVMVPHSGYADYPSCQAQSSPQNITVSSLSESFGNAAVNTVSATHTIVVSNTGTTALTIGAVSLTGANPSEFTNSFDGCTGRTLATSGNCGIQVAFAPKTVGAKTASLSIPSNDPDTPNLTVSVNGVGGYATLTISKPGSGNGTVTSNPAGISCGTGCSNTAVMGAVVTLTATPSADSIFGGWTGGGCSGIGNCVAVMNSTATVTAIFNIKSPIANFTATPTSGFAPLLVSFTDTSTNSPASWSWSFGDGETSTQRNPSHAYTSAGTYTVSLTATNASGSNTIAKSNIISVQACPNQPVRIVRGGTPVYFSSINSAYSSAVDGETIQAQATTFTEGMSSYKTITLDGGYDCTYSSKAGYTTLKGSQVNISGGTATIKDVEIAK